jgi:hypothetical protein
MSMTNQSLDELAQADHFLLLNWWAMFWTLVEHPWFGALTGLGYIVVKEFWFDPRYEPESVSGGIVGDIRDSLWLSIGLLCGYLTAAYTIPAWRKLNVGGWLN